MLCRDATAILFRDVEWTPQYKNQHTVYRLAHKYNEFNNTTKIH